MQRIIVFALLVVLSACKGETSESPATPLPPQPQKITFEAGDGQTLTGRYYPAATNPAPVVVLMHWYPGDQNEWDAIAPYLQNRGLVGEGDGVPWRDPTWFPDVAGDSPVAVFTFTFRGCEGGCREPDPAGWLLDARAAVEQAAHLPGVNPDQIVTVGASIGGDGAMAGCAWLLTQSEGNCLGTLSLSPGDYLIDPYREGVEKLGQATPPRLAWCFYDENEESTQICASLTGDHYQAYGWSDGNLHGLHLLNPNADPNPLNLLHEFLLSTGVITK